MNAMGIVKAMTQPYEVALYSPATLMVRMHHGFVAQDSINACLLAQKGVTGPHQILLGNRGFFNQFLSRYNPKPELITNGLGEEWMCVATMFKPYASG